MTDAERTCIAIGESIALAERSATAALRDGAQMLADLAAASLALSLPVETDHEILARAASGVGLLIDSRKQYLDMHRRARIIAEKTGLVTSYGECPPTPAKGKAGTLTVVASAR